MQTAEKQQQDLIAEFWQASCQFYEKKDSKALLLGLQDEFGYSVNRLLFALWFSQLFHQIVDSKQFSRLLTALEMSEQSVIELRITRRLFEGRHTKPYLGNLNMTRYHMLEGELSIEKEIQSILVSEFCEGKLCPASPLSVETLEFLIAENISILCANVTLPQESATQQLSMLWIRHQGCYNSD